MTVKIYKDQYFNFEVIVVLISKFAQGFRFSFNLRCKLFLQNMMWNQAVDFSTISYCNSKLK